MLKNKLLPIALGFCLAVPMPSYALFEDEKARERIIDVEKKVIENKQAANTEIADLRRALDELESLVKGQGLADLLNQIELLNREVAQIKGELELVNHKLAQAEQREKDLYVDTDERLRAIEESLSAQEAEADAVAASAAAESVEDKQLNQANSLLEEGAYQTAFEVFDQMIKDYPDYVRVDEAKYGLGYAQYSLKNYKSAIKTQQNMIKAHADSTKKPDALMVIGNAQIQLGRVKSAKKTFNSLVKEFPDSSLVPTAQKRLKMLKAF